MHDALSKHTSPAMRRIRSQGKSVPQWAKDNGFTVAFILSFGGAELYLSKDPKGRSRLEALVGHEKAAELAEKVGDLKTRIPLAKPWLAAVFAWQGESTAEIARRLHVTDSSVRKWLRAAGMR